MLPEEDGWTRFDEVAEGSEPADVFLEDGALVVEASGNEMTLFQRREVVSGLAPAYRLEMEASQAASTYAGGWLKLGGYIGALFQDRLMLLFARPVSGDKVQLGVPIDPGDGSPYLLAAHLAYVDVGVFYSLSFTAEREGWVELEVDGTVVGGLDWDQLPLTSHEAVQDLGAVLDVAQDEAGVFFGGIGSRSEFRRVAYEICLPVVDENLEVWLRTYLPDDPADCAVRGGTGETLEGLERIYALVDRVDVVHTAPGEEEGELLTVLDEPQWMDIFDVAVANPTKLVGLTIPEGEVHQVRFVISEMGLDIRGESHDVRVPSGAQSGLKVVLPGGLQVTEEESISLLATLDACGSIGRNRSGYWWDPVNVAGEMFEPWEPPGEGPPHEHPPGRPDICVGPDCPKPPAHGRKPYCADDEVAVYIGQGAYICMPRCEPDEVWDPDIGQCVPIDPPDPDLCRDFPSPPPDVPPDEFTAKPCVCTPGAGGWQELPFFLEIRRWVNNLYFTYNFDAHYNHNQDLSIDLYGNSYVTRVGVFAARVALAESVPPEKGDYLDLWSNDPMWHRPFRTRLDQNSSPDWYYFPLVGMPQAQRQGYYRFQFTSDAENADEGPDLTALRVRCRDEPISQPIPTLDWPNPVVGTLVDTSDVVFLRVPPAGWRGSAPQTLLLRSYILSSAPLIRDGEVHIYARRGALPTPTEYDFAATRSSPDQLLYLPGPGDVDSYDPDKHDFFVAIYSADGWGAFVLKRSVIGTTGAGRVRVGVEWDMTAPGDATETVPAAEEFLVRGARAFFLASQGTTWLGQFDVYNNSTRCGGLIFTKCDIILRQWDTICGDISCHWRIWKGLGTWHRRVEIHGRRRGQPARGHWTFAHELLHLYNQNPPRQSLDEAENGWRRCGHSIMASTGTGRFGGWYRTVCTCHNHGLDFSPNTTAMPPPDRWRRITESVGLTRRDAGRPTGLTAHFMSGHHHGGLFGICRMNYTSTVDVPVEPFRCDDD